jgi:hypothetical protein
MTPYSFLKSNIGTEELNNYAIRLNPLMSYDMHVDVAALACSGLHV